MAAATAAAPATVGGGVSKLRPSLDAHTDDSEVTLNVGLADGFTGGALRFHHVRGTAWEGKTEPFSFVPVMRSACAISLRFWCP